MTNPRRPLSTDDYARFEIEDASNDLYWNGKRVRLGGWSLLERLTAAGIIVAFIGAILAAIITKDDPAKEPPPKAIGPGLPPQAPAPQAPAPPGSPER